MIKDEFLCVRCKNSMVTKVASYQVVPDMAALMRGKQQVQTIREELIQPWCLIGPQPMPLNPTSPIIECEAYEPREPEGKQEVPETVGARSEKR